MAKKDQQDYQYDENGELIPDPSDNPLSEGQLEEFKSALSLFDEADQILDVSAMLDAAGYNAPKIPLAQMSNRPFIIRWMNSFESSFTPGKVAFHCICKDANTGELFRTIIGNARGVEILQAAEVKGIRSGLKMCFEFVEGKGRYGHYYVLK